MTNPQLGFDELAAAQEQPEITVNGADRSITQAIGGQITIDFSEDDNYELQATSPADPYDEWAYGTIVMTDSGTVLTQGRDVIYPDVDTLYGGPSRLTFMFVNLTQQTLTIKRSGETGVAVPAGNAAYCWHDGTDIVAIADVVYET